MRKIICLFLIYGNVLMADEAKTFVVNPTSLREKMLSDNMNLIKALSQVQESKLKVSMARAKLLPTLNLVALLPALANPTFLLGSITFLFPFLVPTKWAALKQEKELFEADKASYKALQLNVLSNSLTLYFTYLNDQHVFKILQDQNLVLERIFQSLKHQSDILGNVTSEDLAMASAVWHESTVRLSKLQELLVEEKAGLRTLLGLPLDTQLKVEEAELLPSEYELKSPGEIAMHALDVAPESEQLDYLIKAAKAGRFSKIFGFLDTASMSGSANDGQSPFSALKIGSAFNFGAEILVNVRIASHNLDSVKLREDELKQECEKTAEIISGQMGEIKKQVELSSLLLKERLQVFMGQRRQFNLGLISLQNLLQTQSALTDAYISEQKSELHLKMQRITLQRLVIDGDFSKIQGCKAQSVKNPRGLLGIRWPRKRSLDELCKH